MLGQHIRAEALAASITDPYERARVLVAVAGALAKARQYEQIAAMASQAETVARSITDPGGQARAAVAAALAKARQYEQIAAMASQAETVAYFITDPDEQARALAAVAGGWPKPANTSAPRLWPGPSRTQAGGRGRWQRWPGRWR